MRCIFCLKEKPPSDEHVFPNAIGGTLHLDRVCKIDSMQNQSCNSILGTVADAPLVNHPFVLIRRSQLNISSYSGKVPDALLELFGKGGVIANDDTQKVRLVKKPRTEGYELQCIYNEKTTVLSDDTKHRQITIDASNGPAVLRKIFIREANRARRNNPEIKIPNDMELDQLVGSCVQKVKTSDPTNVLYKLKVDTVSFHKGIFKIAYELAFLWFGENYLNDPIAAKLRTMIFESVVPESLGVYSNITFGSDIEPLKPWAHDKNAHIAFSAIINGKAVICLKIFDVISAIIEVSEEPDKYVRGRLDPNAIRFIHIDPVSGMKRESSFAAECGRAALCNQSLLNGA